MYKFIEHPAFVSLSSPRKADGFNNWHADFRAHGMGKLKRLDNELSAPHARMITAETLPELAKLCDEFLRVYDAENGQLAPPPPDPASP